MKNDETNATSDEALFDALTHSYADMPESIDNGHGTADERGPSAILRTVFDKRTGRIYYVNSGTCYDAVGGEETKRRIRKITPEEDGE